MSLASFKEIKVCLKFFNVLFTKRGGGVVVENRLSDGAKFELC